MVVSFKISKAGRRVTPKPIINHKENENENEKEKEKENEKEKETSTLLSSANNLKVNVTGMDVEENEVSFTLVLFPDGYFIGRPSENPPSYQAMLQDAPKFLHPYDRTSETFFSAIECGRLPGDILDDLPCKYVNGTVVCEVRDYRSCSSSSDGSPIINKVHLKMSLENVVKDISMMSNSTWTYGDLMEVEARVLKTLQPQLCLDPAPNLDRLCENPVQNKLNLDIRGFRRKRRREMAEINVTSSNEIHQKKACTDRMPESFRDVGPMSGNLMPQHVHENAQNMGSNNDSISSLSFVSQQSKYQMGYTDGMNLAVRRENQEDLLSSGSNLSKRARLTPDGNQQQHMGQTIDSLQSADLQWKNSLLQQQQFVGRGFQYANNGVQKFPQQMYEGGLTNENSEYLKARATSQFAAVAQQGIRFPKEEPVEGDKSELYQNRNELQQRLPHQQAFMRSNIPQPPWNSFGQPTDNNSQKKKSVPSPRGGLPSPLSSKSGEFSSGSVGHQFGPVLNSGVVSSHKDKSTANSVPAVGGATSLTSSANDNSMQRQQQVQLAAKRRSNSHQKISMISGVGSPASVSNMSVPLNSNSPADEMMLPQADPMMLDRFSKIELVTARHQINSRKNKVDENQMRKLASYPFQQVMHYLSSESNGENLIDESEDKELAKSLVGGSMNACKIRVLTFIQNERIMQGNGFALVPKSHIRMILSANPSEGTIAMHYGDMSEIEASAEENLPTLPNSHFADLLAAQLSSLMAREGYEIEDKIHAKPIRMNNPQQNSSNMPQASAEQFSDVVSGQQQYNEVTRPNISGSLPLTQNQNLHSPRMMPPQNPHALQTSQGFGSGPARPQQNEAHSSVQQQPSQLQRSQVMSQVNALGQNTNAMLGNNQIMFKHSHLQMQLMQQQQQPQRKLMMGMGGNMANNVVELGGISNVMGMSPTMVGPRGVGGPTISGPMGSITGMGQNPMNLSGSSNISNTISQQIRNGQLTPQALMAAKLRMGNRGMMGGGAQTGLGGLPGARQMHPGSSGISVLGHSLNNRGMNMNPMQRSAMGAMAPPKLMTGMNPYMNLQLQQQQQQQQQMQLQPHQIQQQQQYQQQQLNRQQDSAPLQAMVSSPQQLSQQSQQQQQQQQMQQASPQQMSQLTPMSPQQMSQRTPMSPQLSSGLNMGNVEACPTSPQLSSQTVGSVSSIANSPMEQLQGANKNSSTSNA